MSSNATRRLVRTAAVLLSLAPLACGGSSGTAPTPAIPNLVGNYTGSWSQDMTMDDQAFPTVACSSTLTVPSQNGNNFYGRATLAPPCDQGFMAAAQGRGGVLAISDGQIQASGAVAFRFSEDPPLADYSGCRVTAMPAFAGSLAGSTISASRMEQYDCTVANGHRYTLTIRLVATRG